MKEKISFQDQITTNKIKSAILLGAILFILIVFGYIISLIVDPAYSFIVLIAAIIISLLYTFFGYYYSDKLALASVRARPASREQHRALFHAAENMSLASGLPMPRLYVMESSEINAFASGRNPQNAVMCFTTGSLERLNKQELEGVLAHEMSHIANYDIRYMTIATVLIGMISIAAEIFLRSLWMSNTDRDSRGNAILLIAGIVLAILAPIVTQLVYLALSRRREYNADATGVKFTRYPPGLASALKKIRDEHVPKAELNKYPKAVAPLFISDPLKRRLQNLFSTHPDINDRIKKLEQM